MSALPALEERTVDSLFASSLKQGPDRAFLVSGTTRLTYRESDAMVGRLASALDARGLRAGDRVALMHASSPRYVLLLLAISRVGAVTVTINTESNGQVLAYYLADAGAVLTILDTTHESIYSAAMQGDGPDALVLADGADWLDALPESQQAKPPPETSFSDVFVTIYTSGSTGLPKGVEITHAQAVTCGLIFAEHMGLTEVDRLYTCLPFFHINATNYTMCGALACGGSIAIGPRFSARSFWHDVAAHGATQLNAMGSMLKILERRDPHPAERAHVVRSVFVAPLPANADKMSERFGVAFATTYAQTEWLPSAMTRPGEGYGRTGLAGRVLPHSEVRVVDELDRPLPPGDVGEIVLRAHEPFVTFGGYVGKPADSLDAFRNLWFHTGDRGQLDADGWLYYRGRTKDVIRRKGENISAAMVEELVAAHLAVLEVAAVPVPDDITEEEIFVYVVPRPGTKIDVDELLRYCVATMPRYMVPAYVSVTNDLPRTATNKIAKPVLVEQARALVLDGTAPKYTER